MTAPAWCEGRGVSARAPVRHPRHKAPGAGNPPAPAPTRLFPGPLRATSRGWQDRGRPGEPPIGSGVSLHCTDEEPEEEEPHRCSQDDSPEAAAGCPGAGRLRGGAEQRPHRRRLARSPLPAAPRRSRQHPPRRPKSRRGPSRPRGGRGRAGAPGWWRPPQRPPPQPRGRP